MRLLTTLFLLFSFALFSTCGGGDDGTAGDVQMPTTISEAVTQAENSLGYAADAMSCLAKEGKSVCDFLDESLIAKYLPEGYEQSSYKPEARGLLGGSCGYQMEHPSKKITVGGGSFSMKVPASYTISLSGIAEYQKDPRQRFRGEYRTMTEAEIAETQARMKAGLKAKLDKGEITQEQYEMASGFGGAVGKSRWEKIEGLGDAAVWGNVLPEREPESSGTLAVLVGNTKFTLDVDLIDSKEKSKAAAIAIARSVIAVCK